MVEALPKLPLKAKRVYRRHVSDGFVVDSESYVSELRLMIVFCYRTKFVIVQV
jgi:hypothetical protein